MPKVKKILLEKFKQGLYNPSRIKSPRFQTNECENARTKNQISIVYSQFSLPFWRMWIIKGRLNKISATSAVEILFKRIEHPYFVVVCGCVCVFVVVCVCLVLCWVYTGVCLQGFKGIRQWPINLCISLKMIHKITLYIDYKFWLKR